MAPRSTSSAASRSDALPADKHADVVTHGDCLRLHGDAGHRLSPPLGQDVVEQHRVEPADQQVAVRMHVVVVRHRLEAVLALGAQQDFVRDRAAERADAAAREIGQRRGACPHRRRAPRAPRGTRSTGLSSPSRPGAPACPPCRSGRCPPSPGRSPDRSTRTARTRSAAFGRSPRAMSSAISTSKPATLLGSAGSASTKGAPPSGSPAHFSSDCCAYTLAEERAPA